MGKQKHNVQKPTPEDRLDRFSRNSQATNWIEVTKKKFVSQNEISFLPFFLTQILK